MREHISTDRQPVHARAELADAIRFYLQLSPRQLPSRFLYDPLGSALFDAICLLPWYRITRSELRLLHQHAATIAAPLRGGGRIVELGSGSGEKLAVLLTHAGIRRMHAHLIDLSQAALARSVQALGSLNGVDVRVTTELATYEEGLLALPAPERGQPTLLAFLGSNIGNFDPPSAAAFLRLMRAPLRAGDFLLVGADLVKPERQLLLAYDDPLGVTAAFNKNLLVRINSELQADFDLDRFAHRAVWNAVESRVEMHLVSLCAQEVYVRGCDLRLRLDADETIWTESSYKYEPAGIRQLVEGAGFTQQHQWLDDEAGFALTMFGVE